MVSYMYHRTLLTHPSTKVLMPNGKYKKAHQVSPGDHIVNHVGHAVQVVSTRPKTLQEGISISSVHHSLWYAPTLMLSRPHFAPIIPKTFNWVPDDLDHDALSNVPISKYSATYLLVCVRYLGQKEEDDLVSLSFIQAHKAERIINALTTLNGDVYQNVQGTRVFIRLDDAMQQMLFRFETLLPSLDKEVMKAVNDAIADVLPQKADEELIELMMVHTWLEEPHELFFKHPTSASNQFFISNHILQTPVVHQTESNIIEIILHDHAHSSGCIVNNMTVNYV